MIKTTAVLQSFDLQIWVKTSREIILSISKCFQNIIKLYQRHIFKLFCFLCAAFGKTGFGEQEKCIFLYLNRLLCSISVSNTPRSTYSFGLTFGEKRGGFILLAHDVNFRLTFING